MRSEIVKYFKEIFKVHNTSQFLVDIPKMNIIAYNNASKNLFDISDDREITGKRFYEVTNCHFKDQITDETISQFKDHLFKEGSYQDIRNIQTPSGKKFIGKVEISPFENEEEQFFIIGISNITEEETNRIELEQIKETYKSIYNQLPDGVVTHIDGIIKSCNDTFLAYNDDHRRNIYGTRFVEMFSNDDREKIEKHIINPTKGDIIIVSKKLRNGIWHKYTLESFREKYFNEDVVVTIVSDYQLQENLAKEQLRAKIASEANVLLEKEIEKHKETRKKLETSQEISKSVFNSSIDTIISTDMENRITEVSPSACYTFGYEMDEFLGKKSIELYADMEEFKRIEKQLKSDGFYIGEINNLRKDGTKFTSFISCAEMKNNKGDQIGFMGISRDITDLKKAEQELIESEKKYRDLFVNLSDTVIVVNQNNEIIEMNNAALHLFEIDGNGFHNLIDFVYEEDKTYVEKRSREFREKGSIINVEFRIQTDHKRIKTVNLSSSAMYENGVFIGSRDIIRDITSQKEAEQNLTKSIKEKEVLLKEVHHRVKNNLQVISSILNLQSSYVKDANTLTILRESQNRVKSMSFIHESLYRSKDFSQVNFSDYINNLINNIIHSFYLTESSVNLITDLNAISLNLDQAIPCGLIVNELLTNAMKYAFEGIEAPELYVELNQEGNTVIIKIEDNGVGLPRGFKIDESDSLGLQLVQTLIEQLEGSIRLNVEKGTKYFITFEKVT